MCGCFFYHLRSDFVCFCAVMAGDALSYSSVIKMSKQNIKKTQRAKLKTDLADIIFILTFCIDRTIKASV